MKKYFDNASTTKINIEVLNSFNEAVQDFYNPSSLNVSSIAVKQKIEQCRANFLKYLNGAPKSKFIFTGSATESNNAVLRANIKRKDKKHIISAGEHSSIYNTAKELINQGYNIEICPLNENGTINEDILYSMLDDKTVFISIIHVSNETGAVNDIERITKKIKAFNKNIVVHSDGVQALHKLDINLIKMGVDYYTISSHKIGGFKGIAGLYIANGVSFNPFILGGGQELGLRAGTENYPAIKAFETALYLDYPNQKDIENLKNTLLSNLTVPFKLISQENCLPHIISIAFNLCRGETIMHQLDDLNFIVGTGSACNSKDTTNRVLDAMGIDKKLALGNIRISFEPSCTEEDCIALANAINSEVSKYLQKTQK